MANVFLSANETFTAANNGLVIKGAAGGTEKLLIGSNVTGVTTDANIERIEVAGNLADYKFVIGASGIQITNAAGTVIATIPSLNQATTLAFADGSASLVQTGATAATLGGAALSTATAAAVTVTTPLNTTDKSTVTAGSTGGATVPGQSFSLTSATENKTLTVGNDTVDGATAVDSISGDTIVDSSTTDSDTLNVVVSGNVNPSSVLYVENVNVTAKYGSATVDASKYVGVKALVADSSLASGGVVVNNATSTSIPSIKAGTNVAALTVTTATTAGTLAVDAGSASTLVLTGTASSTEVINLALNGGSAGLTATVLADTGDTLNITGKTAANTVTFAGTAAGAKTVVALGDQDLTLKGDSDVFKGNTLTNSLTAGKTLTLAVTAATTASPDLSKVAASTIIDLQAVSTGATFATGANVKLNTTTATALTSGTASGVLNLDLLLGTTGALTQGATTFTTVNAKANTVDVTSLDAQLGATALLNLSGSKNVALPVSATAKVVDASGLTGKLSVTLEGTADVTTITGGSGSDTVTTGTAASALTASLGLGDDTVVLGITPGANKYVLDGGSGTDTLQIKTGNIDFSAATAITSVITGFEKLDVNGKTLTLTQTQLASNGTTFEVKDTATGGTFAIVDDAANVSRTFDISNLTFSGTAPTITVTGRATDTNTIKGPSVSATLTGGGYVDAITGGAGNDTIIGGAGADNLDGGAGNDAISYSDVTAAGSHSLANLSGVAVNLSSAAITAATIATAMNGTAGTVVLGGGAAVAGADLASNTAGYLVATAANSTATMVRDTLVNFENVIGSDLKDYIVGSANSNTISGGTGGDVIIGGSGVDTFGVSDNFGKTGQSVIASANALTAGGIAAADTLTFATTVAGNVDRILDFVSGTDKLDVATAGVAPTNLAGVTVAASITAGTTYVAYGSYVASTGVFTVAGAYNATTAPDAVVYVGDGTLTAVNTTGYVVLTGLNQALVAADFV